jgi:hypothetical protein
MSAASSRFENARKHLDVFEESWKADHEEAMLCRDFEAFLAQGILVFEYLASLDRSWRDLVYRGVEKPDPEAEKAVRESLSRWLRVADELTTEMEQFERTFGMVEGADKIRSYQAKARALIKDWISPAPARAASLRVWDMTEEEADGLRELLSAPPGAPGRLKVEPKPLPTAGPSILG